MKECEYALSACILNAFGFFFSLLSFQFGSFGIREYVNIDACMYIDVYLNIRACIMCNNGMEYAVET